MENKNTDVKHLFEYLWMAFDVLSDAIEIADFQLPDDAKKVALLSRTRSLSRMHHTLCQVEVMFGGDI